MGIMLRMRTSRYAATCEQRLLWLKIEQFAEGRLAEARLRTNVTFVPWPPATREA